MNEGDRADTQGGPVNRRRTVAVLVQALLDDPQDNAQRRVECRPISLPKVVQSLWDRQHPLAHRQTREDVPAAVTAGASKAVRKDATFEAFA